MNFSEALQSLKLGSRICRQGWNGKEMFLFLVEGGTMNYPALPCELQAQPYIAIKTAQNTVVPWLASQSDLLAEDWVILIISTPHPQRPAPAP